VFLDPLIQELNEKRSKVSIAGSLLIACYAFAGPIAAQFVARFGTRTVCITGSLMAAVGLGLSAVMNSLIGIIITYSIVSGIGFGMMYIPSVIAVANHFTRLRSMAIGICLCGAGVGTFVLAPFESYLIDEFSIKITFFILSSLCVMCALLAITMRPVKFVEANQSSEEQVLLESTEYHSGGLCDKILGSIIDRQLYTSPEFWLYMFAICADLFATFGLFIPYQHLLPIARSAGLTKSQADFLISIIGISSAVGRLVAGWVCDRGWLHPSSICGISMLIVSPACFVVTVASTYHVFIIMAFLFGFFTGCWVAVMSPLFIRILGLHLLAPAFGLLTGLRGISALVGPPLAAKLVESFEDRCIALYCSCLCMGISSIIFFCLTICSRSRMRRREYSAL